MHEVNKVVARLLDGSVIKGASADFFPNRSSFHVHEAGAGAAAEVLCERLKAVFFVKDLAGNSQRQDAQGFPASPAALAAGKKIAVRFKDGELICGYTLAYTPDRSGFFMTPSDPASNNIRIYVLTHATKQVGVGPKAEQMAQAKTPPRAA